ncbi:hypothetical protein LUZ63_008639 [Rhynchospora breviuscula]|uniref:DNA (cytosine-5-)-methyltransferase n=1 Tax=Rhynchospora breviuscula TaxID=2022672 RepID=A0A9Q0CTZ7_9POAL|nr:hypothetical protein LUZ63_008639 [Rhynchospora breviuscula]
MVSDSDESADLSWLLNDDETQLSPRIQGCSSEDAASNSSLMPHFLDMGFPRKMITKAIEESGDGNSESVLDLLLIYSSLAGTTSRNEEKAESDENSWADDSSSYFDEMDLDLEMAGQDSISNKLQVLVKMGYDQDEAASAVKRCGEDASAFELADSIYAAQTAKEEEFGDCDPSSAHEQKDGDKYDPFLHDHKRQRFDDGASSSHRNNNQRRGHLNRAYGRPSTTIRHHGGGSDDDREAELFLPNSMVGFGLPMDPKRQIYRKLPDVAQGPPFFYYENVALAPRGVWDTISRMLDNIPPEFVDSQYFSAACRKRGYIHNLPIANRFHLKPVPPQTILEAFPSNRAHWPEWDKRTKFNCLQTVVASSKLTEKIHAELKAYPNPPSLDVMKRVMKECRKWNLIWIGQKRVAPLEPHEVEFLLGFPRDHTRSISRTERYRSLGNSFNVDTVAYHLSVLKGIYPNGIRILSLFSGIGGAEVALHRLGIKMTAVLSVEKSLSNRNLLNSWWKETGQEGELQEIDDVRKVDDAILECFIRRHGGFDLVIGGSPCNNLTGSNRLHRIGLQGEHSSLFYHYYRILSRVRYLMGKH